MTQRSLASLAATSAATLALLTGLSACGDDTPDADAPASDAPSSAAPSATESDTPSAASDAGDPAEALKAILAAYTSGDAAFACSRQTEAYTRFSIDQVVATDALPAGATCEDTVRFSGEMAAKFKVDNSQGGYETTADDGSTATVVHDQGGTPYTYTLTVEDGVWKIDAEAPTSQ